RSLAGVGTQPAWASQTYERPRPEVPAVVLRLAAEAALIVAVAVIAGVAHLSSAAIVVLMLGAFLVVAVSEWLAARSRFVSPVGGFVAVEALEPPPYVEAPAPVTAQAWGELEPEPEEAEQESEPDVEPEAEADPEVEPGEPDE